MGSRGPARSAEWQLAWNAGASQPCSLEQLRRELVEVLLPVDPRVAALALLEDRVQPHLLQQVDRLAGLVEQEVLRAGTEPEQLQSLLGVGVVELALELLFPVDHVAEQEARAEDADVAVVLQVGQGIFD